MAAAAEDAVKPAFQLYLKEPIRANVIACWNANE